MPATFFVRRFNDDLTFEDYEITETEYRALGQGTGKESPPNKSSGQKLYTNLEWAALWVEKIDTGVVVGKDEKGEDVTRKRSRMIAFETSDQKAEAHP